MASGRRAFLRLAAAAAAAAAGCSGGPTDGTPTGETGTPTGTGPTPTRTPTRSPTATATPTATPSPPDALDWTLEVESDVPAAPAYGAGLVVVPVDGFVAIDDGYVIEQEVREVGQAVQTPAVVDLGDQLAVYYATEGRLGVEPFGDGNPAWTRTQREGRYVLFGASEAGFAHTFERADEDEDTRTIAEMIEISAPDLITDRGRLTVPVPVDGTVVGDSAYFVGGDEAVAVDVAEGEERWRVSVPAEGDLVGLRDGAVVFRGEGALGAVERADGAVRWVEERPTRWAATAGSAVVAAEDGGLTAVSIGDGSERWRTDGFGAAPGPAVAGDDVVVRVAAGRTVYALDTTSGERRWTWTAPAPVRQLVADDGTTYVRTERTLHAVETGTERWHFEPGLALSPVTVAGGGVYVATRTVGDPSDAVGDPGVVYAFES